MRKPLTIETMIAQEFRRFLREHPNLKKKQRIAAFNRIADKYLVNEKA